MATERCPACRSRLSAEPGCPRCGCDLSLVRRAETQAQQLLARSVRAWARGDQVEAAALARAARALDDTRLAAAVLRGLRPL